eukprot:TRINITY_DN8440_c0_g2_i2.p1 TRINITY_DN8440_c0_g2~~TRINITY_DN8440_c0_g2_i2.p1  ORF type:complete len:519 (+),score=62.43 TRINITY_DN8440_c0_g2_i2:215-1771(+)
MVMNQLFNRKQVTFRSPTFVAKQPRVILFQVYPKKRQSTFRQNKLYKVCCKQEVQEKDIERKNQKQKQENDKPSWVQDFQVYGQAKAVGKKKKGFFSKKSFKEIGVSDKLMEVLNKMGIWRPSHIQELAIQLYEEGHRRILMADHAGSGKTLAYLLPIVKELREEEDILGKENTLLPYSPRAIVVCPTTELAAQVVRVCRALAKSVPFTSAALTGGHVRRSQIKFLKDGIDLVVCTPGRLIELIESKHVKLDFCRAIVLDEIDVLWRDEQDFREKILRLKEEVKRDMTKFIFVTATIPKDVWEDLQMEFPKIKEALGPGLHRLTPGAREVLIDCSGGDEISLETGIQRKLDALQTLFLKSTERRTIIFCNKIENCRKVENLLNRNIDDKNEFLVLPYHKAVRDDIREENLVTFLASPQRTGKTRMVLVCTDRASRGLDSAHVEHVILFDYPRDPSEYVRRVGRTARGAQGQGKVSILVLGKQVQLAQEMISRNKKGIPIHKVPFDEWVDRREMKKGFF